MSELALYVIATIVVLAGVAYFFVKQREQEAQANKSRRGAKQPKAKKEEKKETEKKEAKSKRARPPKEPLEAAAPTKRKAKEEDDTKSVLDFLKNQKFTSDKAEKGAQAKVRSAPAAQEKKAAPAPKKAAKVESSSEESGSSGDEGTEYTTIKRKGKASKDKTVEESDTTTTTTTTEGNKKNKSKFFTKAERDADKAEKDAAHAAFLQRKADREARASRAPGEKPKEGDSDFEAYMERKQRRDRERKERAAAQAAAAGEDGENRRKPKFEPREPDAPPVFPNHYEAADIDNILNNLTSYYAAHPEAGRSKPRPQATAEPDAVDAE